MTSFAFFQLPNAYTRCPVLAEAGGYDSASFVTMNPACSSCPDVSIRACSATTPKSNGRPLAIISNRWARLMPFAVGEASRRTFNACEAISPTSHQTLMRLAGERGIPSTVGLYVPELSHPQAAHRSENRPQRIERSMRDKHTGQLAGSAIFNVAANEFGWRT